MINGRRVTEVGSFWMRHDERLWFRPAERRKKIVGVNDSDPDEIFLIFPLHLYRKSGLVEGRKLIIAWWDNRMMCNAASSIMHLSLFKPPERSHGALPFLCSPPLWVQCSPETLWCPCTLNVPPHYPTPVLQRIPLPHSPHTEALPRPTLP